MEWLERVNHTGRLVTISLPPVNPCKDCGYLEVQSPSKTVYFVVMMKTWQLSVLQTYPGT